MSSPIVENVLSGENRQLTRLAAQGLLPIAPDDLIMVQVKLTRGDDEEIAGLAREALQEADANLLMPILRDRAGPAVLSFFARTSEDRRILETILRRKGIPTELLHELAPRLPAALQEVFLLRQDRITEDPSLLESLEQNPELSTYSVRKIAEYREHLVGSGQTVADEGKEAPAEEEVAAREADGRPEQAPEVAEAIREVKEAGVGEGEIDEESGLSEAEIMLLPIPVRLKLARGAPRTLRNMLLRDNNAQVAMAVMTSNPLADQEVEQIARSRNVVEEVLEYIANQRRWVKKYTIMHSLIKNPRTPVGVSTRLVPRLSIRDLRNLSRDRNVPDAVRSRAKRIYKVKSG